METLNQCPNCKKKFECPMKWYDFNIKLRGDLVEYDNKLRLSYNVARI